MMFGLKSPLTRDIATPEFDSVNTILSNSVYNGSTGTTLPQSDNKGKLFYLELSEREHFSSGLDNCGTTFCDRATDDTGYGSENDEHLNSHDAMFDNTHNPFPNEVFSNYSKFIDLNYDKNSDVTSFDTENVDFSKMDGIRKVRLKVKPVDLQKVNTSNKNRKTGQLGRILCKELIGIIPGHFRTKVNGILPNGQRLCIRGLVPHSHAAKYSDIHLGDCLRLVNGREVTWDNIDEVFLKISTYQEVTIVLQQVITRQPKIPVLTKVRTASSDQNLIHLIKGYSDQDDQADVETDKDDGLSAVMFIDLDKLKSEDDGGEDMVYQYPRRSGLLTSVRGAFVTLFQTMRELSETGVRRSCFSYDGELVHVSYHKEENSLLLLMTPEIKISGKVLPYLLEDLVRLIRVLHGSVIEAFSNSENHKELDGFFCLCFHMLGVLQSGKDTTRHGVTWSLERCLMCRNIGVQYLPLTSSVSDNIDRLLNGWESADWGHVSENLFGCRRSFTILGSCLFYKNLLLSSHLPKEDLFDVYLYLQYQCLLLLSSKDKIQQLVVWRKISSTRQSYDLGEEQMFGYTEPVDARLFWLIVGYENTIMCSVLEARGNVLKSKKTLAPDSLYIDQAKATLMQINSLDLSRYCDQRNNIQNTALASSLHMEKPPASQRSFRYPVTSSPKLDMGMLHRRRLASQQPIRKDSIQSDESMDSNSSGGSLKRLSRNRLSTESRDDRPHDFSLPSEQIRLTSGASNSLLHFLHLNKYEGIFISPFETGQIEPKVLKNFHLCCSQIKHMFDKYRYRRKVAAWDEDNTSTKIPIVQDKTFYNIREEGVLFTISEGKNEDNNPTASSYWVIGRRRSKEEIYVCFKDGIPQNMVEMAFTIAFGLTV